MSAPESPTRTKRNAILARSAAMRKSQADAMTAPAPATVPLSAATTGRGQRRMARIRSQVSRVNTPELGELHAEQRADDVLDVAARSRRPAPRR